MSMSSKKEAVFITSLVTFWYSSNIGVILLNKYLLSNHGFKFPIFLTMCHMSACALLSYISIVFLKIVPFQTIKSRSQFIKISTLSIVFCASVVGGNISLRYLAVSFNQAVGATTPFFTALFAYMATLKREAWVTYAALVPVVAGVVIASGVCLFCLLDLILVQNGHLPHMAFTHFLIILLVNVSSLHLVLKSATPDLEICYAVWLLVIVFTVMRAD